jgi:hypothetical protein
MSRIDPYKDRPLPEIKGSHPNPYMGYVQLILILVGWFGFLILVATQCK